MDSRRQQGRSEAGGKHRAQCLVFSQWVTTFRVGRPKVPDGILRE